ncbi:MAG: hypothetical protein UT42_C0039G0005 [Candidatus Falkowbacteria bacterium GW2011_GWA2_39_24]|uniref:Uncharacterized protein n=1 Tax=Candidatus Falkowbacteria bacterium GW2011_GWA2_39_24 TaxID=1618634 RepID=A0A0G0QTS0_9BACT|nr:MAG: hypothetical protein UT42_C0039G0005 [Candidatus Falkowbacteria bacterium GW2011_GWA2_39_24]
MEISFEKFTKIKSDAESFYKTIGEVHCPYFNERITFNSKGLDHIKFKEWNKTRLIKDQYLRLKFLCLSPEIIKKSHTLQEFRESNNFERQKINSRWERRIITVKYYAFVAILNNIRLKIIIKEIEGGKKFFWSIYPYWKQRRNYDGRIKKALYEGDLETQ